MCLILWRDSDLSVKQACIGFLIRKKWKDIPLMISR